MRSATGPAPGEPRPSATNARPAANRPRRAMVAAVISICVIVLGALTYAVVTVANPRLSATSSAAVTDQARRAGDEVAVESAGSALGASIPRATASPGGRGRGSDTFQDPRRVPVSGAAASTGKDADSAGESAPSAAEARSGATTGDTTSGADSASVSTGLSSLSQVSKVGVLSGADFPAGVRITIRSTETGMFVGTEKSGSNAGMVRAGFNAADVAGGFTFSWNSKRAAWAIRSSVAGKYVTDNDTAGSEVEWLSGSRDTMLSATSTSAATWEMFKLYRNADGTYYLRAKATGLYVAPELNYTGDLYAMLRARGPEPGSWERLTLS